MDNRELNVQEAKLAEQAERYDDMKLAMEKVVKCGGKLSSEERNLLSVAFKNVCGARRSSWRVVSSFLSNTNITPSQLAVGEKMKKKIEEELNVICSDVLSLIDDDILKRSKQEESEPEDPEHNTFFNKMKGDYYRYQVEVAGEDTKQALTGEARLAYEEANKCANELPTTHPVRLGLALNFSVFYYEIENDPEKACGLAKKAFDEAIAELDTLKEDSYKDSTLIMQLLRDNLTLWTSSLGDESEEQQE
ncbi:14-3-3 protein zeta/delta-like isoform X2 [Antedon mediterranea]|uniref:14-3-3 protein zeta/delta-like isoform X2 n=1 Tax=Antedon mediterranea TaxID=105859 RepID=UPI003AF534D3